MNAASVLREPEAEALSSAFGDAQTVLQGCLSCSAFARSDGHFDRVVAFIASKAVKRLGLGSIRRVPVVVPDPDHEDVD